MSKTKDNLKEAFAGESQANRKYLAFAKQAELDGLPQVAKLFRAVAEAETIHAHAHLRLLKGVRSTTENLEAAREGEIHEFKSMYPAMIADAEAEGEKAAARYFDFANKVEEIHSKLYEKALANPSGLAETVYSVCAVCGHTLEGEATDKCPICGAPADKYFVVQ